MAYYNDASFHPTSSTVRESDPSPFLGRSSASSTEESNTNTLREPVERSPAKTPSRPTADHPDYWDRDGSFIPTLAQELPSLKSCKNPFSCETLRNRVLTDHSHAQGTSYSLSTEREYRLPARREPD